MPTLPKRFFQRDAVAVAQDLVGRVLVHHEGGKRIAGRIVEVEAYGARDPACHASRGKTERNAAMFAQGGIVYVYRIYGIHWCANLVTGPKGQGEAVLIRALEPVEGIEQMAKRRGLSNHDLRLARGPGCVCQALGISIEHNFASLASGPLRVETPRGFCAPAVVATPRIGISKATDKLWRFIDPNSRYLSGTRKLNVPTLEHTGS